MDSSSSMPVPESHALYDAGLLNAGKTIQRSLFAKLRAKNTDVHLSHVQSWAIPWYVESTADTPHTIDDYRRDTVNRLLKTLVDKGEITERESRSSDITRFTEHWAHVLIRESMRYHRAENYDDHQRFTAEHVLLRTRHVLHQTFTRKMMVAESPVHPFWGKRGSMQRSKNETPIWTMEATHAQKEFARLLLQPTINLAETMECEASDIMREAVPELLERDTTRIIEYAFVERRTLRKLLEGYDSFKEQNGLRKKTIELLLDILVMIGKVPDAQLESLQIPGLPNIIDGEANDVINAYIAPFMENPHANAAELSRRFPIVMYLLLRTVMMESTHETQSLLKLYTTLFDTVNVDPGMYNLATLIIGASQEQAIPRDIRIRI